MITFKHAAGMALALMLPLPTAAQAQTEAEICENVANITENIAYGYQVGMPLSEMLATMALLLPDVDQKPLQKVILEVYSGQRFATEELQERSIAEWRNTAHVECLR